MNNICETVNDLHKSKTIYGKQNSLNMSNFKEAVDMETFSFQKGWKQVRLMDVELVREDIQNALHFTSDPTWRSRLNGRVPLIKSEVAAIEAVFAKYAITEIWGE